MDYRNSKIGQMELRRLGQVFTPSDIVDKMLLLRKHRGSILEPAVGCGAFMSRLGKNAVGIELDKSLIPANDKRIVHSDFFSFAPERKFHTIIGNPPYVRYQEILPSTRKLLDHDLFDRRSNLYLFFIAKCIDLLENGGGLIMIAPRDFIKSTNTQKLNGRLFRQGSFTHFYELGDARVFSKHTPNCAIWRWEKGRKLRRMATGGSFCCSRGQIWIGYNANTGGKLADMFDI